MLCVLMFLLAVPAPLEPTLRDAELVVDAEIISINPRWARDGRHIVSEVEVEVRSSWRGAAPQRLTVLQRGGRVGDVEQRVSDEPLLVVRAHVVLALERCPGERFRARGAWRVVDGEVELAAQRRTLAAVRLEVQR